MYYKKVSSLSNFLSSLGKKSQNYRTGRTENVLHRESITDHSVTALKLVLLS